MCSSRKQQLWQLHSNAQYYIMARTFQWISFMLVFFRKKFKCSNFFLILLPFQPFYITNKPQEAYVTVDLPWLKDAVMHNAKLYSATPVLRAWRCNMHLVADLLQLMLKFKSIVNVYGVYVGVGLEPRAFIAQT